MIERKKVMIQWFSTSDRLPEHEQEVLIHCQGKYYMAIFHQDAGGFLLRGGALFRVNDWNINWAKLGGPHFSK
jgi:hypothetical protein